MRNLIKDRTSTDRTLKDRTLKELAPEDRTRRGTKRNALSLQLVQFTSALVLFGIVLGVGMWSGCSSSANYNNNTQFPPTLEGNWQFAMGEQLNSDPTKPSFTGGLTGGFLLQNNDSVTGQLNFLVMTQPPLGSGGQPTPCNSGVDSVTGTLSGQTVNLTATPPSGGQTFTLTGTLDYSGTTITGTYTSTDGAGCGIVATSSWSATLVPELTGSLQGVFHSMGGTAGLNEQDFLVSGLILQGPNNGGSSVSVTGNLNFVDATTANADYPCIALANVSGTISGNLVSLQIQTSGGTTVGQIGQSSPSTSSGPQAVTFNTTGAGTVLQSLAGAGYAMYAASCGGGTLQNPADSGSVCIGVNTSTACEPPFTVAPAALSFPAQSVGSKASTLAITLTNPTNTELNGITLTLVNTSGPGNFSETDNCGVNGAASQGQQISLLAKQYCTISIGFAPKQNCATGTVANQCLSGALTVNSPTLDTILNVPLTGGVN